MIKIIWGLVILNSIGLLIFISAYFVLNNGKNVDYQEKGWTLILACVGFIIILLAAIPLRFSQSTGTLIFSGIFAALPLAIVIVIYVGNQISSYKKEKTFAETFYKDKTQRNIAAAIENNDTTKLKELIQGQDVNKRGPKIWDDEEGLTYLQFVVKIRSNPISFSFDENANIAAIKILLAAGARPTPALSQGIKYLSRTGVLLLLDAGADPNVRGYVDPAPLIFEAIGPDKNRTDMAILLIQRGANVNALKDSTLTPVMFAAYQAGTSKNWVDTWRLVGYLLEEAKADYTFTASNGASLATIMQKIQQEAVEGNINMPPDFNAVVAFLQQRKILTVPITPLKQPL
ncbi:MAG: hypothetical protein ABI151_04945 [Chitinophagaceae bacterium]